MADFRLVSLPSHERVLLGHDFHVLAGPVDAPVYALLWAVATTAGACFCVLYVCCDVCMYVCCDVCMYVCCDVCMYVVMYVCMLCCMYVYVL